MENDTLLKIMERFTILEDRLEEVIKHIDTVNDLFHVRSNRQNIYAALAAAKLEYGNVRFNRENSFNKQVYADLDQIEKATRKALSNNGLTFNHEPMDIDGTTFLFSVLGHSSGQEIRCKNRLVIPSYTGAKSDSVRYGEALAMLKRQVTQCMLGITVNNDQEDNDDADNSEKIYEKESMRALAGDERSVVVDQGVLSEKITNYQLDELYRELELYPLMTKNLLRALEIKSLSDMPRAIFQQQIHDIRNKKIKLSNYPKSEW